MDNKHGNKATIHDVARRAGVSPGTVSRAINCKGYLKEETRKKIFRVIEEMQYIPNRAGRALKTTKTGLILLAIPDTDNNIFVGMIEAVNEAVKQNGCSMVLYYTAGTLEGELEAVRMLRENLVDGLFLINFSYEQSLRDAIKSCYAPVVLCGMCNSLWAGREDNGFDTISIDVYRGIYDSTTHFIKNGHKKIAYLAGVKGITVYQQRFEAYMAALRDYNLPYNEGFVFWNDYSEESGYEAGRRLFFMNDRPTAMCASNDLQAIGFWRACRDYGIAIPEEVALCGMDNIDVCEIVKMSSINMWEGEVGETGARLLMERLEKTNLPPRTVSFRPLLIVRQSSAVRLIER